MSPKTVLVLVKRSSYRKYVEDERDSAIEALIRNGDPTVRRMVPGHMDHEETVDEVRTALAALGASATFESMPRTDMIDRNVDLVVTVGGDGTLLAASHLLGPEIPLLGVNSAPDHSVGFFCAARKGSAKETIAQALSGSLEARLLTRMQVGLNDMCLHSRVLNEALFCHASPAATSRYILELDRRGGARDEEEQKSSGIWIGPAAGSTAAQRSAGGDVLRLSSTALQFVVREPYLPYGKPMRMVLGRVDDGETLTLRNKMQKAKLFLDGEHIVYDVALGDVLTMKKSDEPLRVLGLTRDGEGEIE